MTFRSLSPEARETARGMIEHCIDHGLCMGMDEGTDVTTDKEHPFLVELRAFVATPQKPYATSIRGYCQCIAWSRSEREQTTSEHHPRCPHFNGEQPNRS